MRFALWTALSLFALVGPSHACCTAFPPGPDTTVKIADQEIVVAWNPATKTEHFIRQATFRSRAEGFGFLVPTPTQPQLAEVKSAVFDRLRQEIEPRIVHRTRYVPQPMALCLCPFVRGALPASAPRASMDAPPPTALSVEVLQQVRVAGYDAAVLSATDAGALAAWLQDNGYDARPALRQWLEPYVAAKWIVTAFKFAATAGQVETGSLRMSFQTDRPLFPYRVPTDLLAPAGQGNTLRVFFVGPGRASGTLGEAKSAWAGALKYSSKSPRTALATLLSDAVPAGDLATDAWLTAFEDGTWPSGTEDLWFSTDAAGQEVIPTVEVWRDEFVPIPLDVILVLGIVAVVLVRRRRRQA